MTNAPVRSIDTLLSYKAWADEITYQSALKLPKEEVNKERPTNFGTIARTLNHVFVVDDIFFHHLTGARHSYTARNTDNTPVLSELFERQQKMNAWFIDHAKSLSSVELASTVQFKFVGGGAGAMTREQILLHLVNHATYHRGFVSDLMYQIPVRPQANDLSVYLREITANNFQS